MNSKQVSVCQPEVLSLLEAARDTRIGVTHEVQDSPWPDDLFPLRLSLFESYMLVDDRPSYPMTIVIDVRVSGDLDQRAFLTAYQRTLDRHPLLQCVVQKVRGKWCWVPACERVRPVEWLSTPEALPQREQPIDLLTDPGLRTWVCYRPQESKLIFQFHHAVTDGLGAVRVIGDLLAIYGQLTTPPGEEAPELRPVTYERLRDRGLLWPDGRPYPGTIRKLILRTLKLAFKVPAPVVGPVVRHRLYVDGQQADDQQRFPNMVSKTFDRKATLQIKREAARRNVTTNDLYSLALFQTLRQWNDTHGGGRRKSFRLAVPISLRTPLHDDSPAANVLSYMALTSYGDEQPQDLLQTICRQTADTVGGVEAPLVTLGVGGVMSRLPWLGRLISRSNYCFTSAILTNIGEVRRQVVNRFPLRKGRCIAGSVTLEALVGTAPIRPLTSVSVAVGNYAGQLFVNANCDPGFFSNVDAQAFLDLFANQLQGLVEEPTQAARQSA